LSSVETITVQNTTQTASITLTDAVYTANGLTALTVDNVTATSAVLTLAAGSLSAANSVRVIVSKTDNSGSLNLVLGSGNDSVVIDGDAVNNTSTITAGAGTDTLEIISQTTTATAAIDATITGFETVLFSTAAGTYAFSTADGNVASGATQTVNASAMTGTLLWDGALELDGLFSITTGSGADALTGGAKNDTISSGAGDDTIVGGLGADVLTGGAGVDNFNYTLGTALVTTQSNATLTDTITDWTSGTDKLQFTLDYSTISTGATIDATIQTARAGTSLIQDNLSGSRAQVVYDTTGSALYVNVNEDNLLTTADFKININPAPTATATVVEGDINFVITGGIGADTITAGGGADNITGGAGADSITGGAGADTLVAGLGIDLLIGGTGGDTYTLGETADVDTVRVAAGDSTAVITVASARATYTGVDTVTTFSVAGVDILDLSGTAALATSGAVDGTNSTAVLTATATDAILSHQISATGLTTFDDAETYNAAVTLGDAGDVGAAIQYLSLNDIGNAAMTVIFAGTGNGGASYYVYQQTAATAGSVGGYTVVELVGITATGGLMTTGTTAATVLIS